MRGIHHGVRVGIAALVVVTGLQTPAVAGAVDPPSGSHRGGSSIPAYVGSAASILGSPAAAATGDVGSVGPTIRTGPSGGVREYVALGDSYAALGQVFPGDWSGGPPQCVRTGDAYPGVVADALRPARFVNATCAGGLIDHLWGPRDGVVPPQFDALGSDTDLVTLSIGGNDVGLADVILSCVIPPPLGAAGPLTPSSVAAAGAESVAGVTSGVLSPAATDLSATGDPDRLALPAPAVARTGSSLTDSIGTPQDCRTLVEEVLPARLTALADDLDAVHAEIRRRSPDAVVVATGYLALLPLDGSTCPILDTIPRDVVPSLVAFERALDRVVAEAATRNGALAALATDTPGHDVCAPPGRRWVDVLGAATGAGPVHPTRAGQAHVAGEVLDVLAAVGIGPGRTP